MKWGGWREGVRDEEDLEMKGRREAGKGRGGEMERGRGKGGETKWECVF